MLVSFGAAAKHCAFYPGAFPIEVHRDELKDYENQPWHVPFGSRLQPASSLEWLRRPASLRVSRPAHEAITRP